MPEAAPCITGLGTAGLSWAENKSATSCLAASSTAGVGAVATEQCLAGSRARLPCSSRPESSARCSGKYYQVPCHVPSLCHVCAVCCVQRPNTLSNERYVPPRPGMSWWCRNNRKNLDCLQGSGCSVIILSRQLLMCSVAVKLCWKEVSERQQVRRTKKKYRPSTEH